MIKCFFKQLAGINVPKEARQLITTKVHEKSEAAYERMRQELLDVTNQYFLNNWDSCKEKWVTFLHDENVYFADTTNYRLECLNHKLKEVTTRFMCIPEMFESVHVPAFCRSNAPEYDHKSSLRSYHQLLQPMIAFQVCLK